MSSESRGATRRQAPSGMSSCFWGDNCSVFWGITTMLRGLTRLTTRPNKDMRFFIHCLHAALGDCFVLTIMLSLRRTSAHPLHVYDRAESCVIDPPLVNAQSKQMRAAIQRAGWKQHRLAPSRILPWAGAVCCWPQQCYLFEWQKPSVCGARGGMDGGAHPELVLPADGPPGGQGEGNVGGDPGHQYGGGGMHAAQEQLQHKVGLGQPEHAAAGRAGVAAAWRLLQGAPGGGRGGERADSPPVCVSVSVCHPGALPFREASAGKWASMCGGALATRIFIGLPLASASQQSVSPYVSVHTHSLGVAAANVTVDRRVPALQLSCGRRAVAGRCTVVVHCSTHCWAQYVLLEWNKVLTSSAVKEAPPTSIWKADEHDCRRQSELLQAGHQQI
jgi:hypothetical protein